MFLFVLVITLYNLYRSVDIFAGQSLQLTSYTTSITTTPTISWHSLWEQPSKNLPERVCTSPEKDVPWIFGKETSCNRSKAINEIFVQSQTGLNMCGYCKDDYSDDASPTKERQFARYLFDLSGDLRAWKEQQCSSLIVYGVAFGKDYVRWLTSKKKKTRQVSSLLQLHGPCFISFVLAEHLVGNSNIISTTSDGNNNYSSNFKQRKSYISGDGLQLLIPIERMGLPYTSMRRNTKIFKMMGPSFLFGSWVERVIWQDAKLVAYQKNKLPNNYYDYFFHAIHMTSVPRNSNPDHHPCASFMGLPYHIYTMGRKVNEKKNGTVQFADHCDTIIKASKNRPSISDDIRSVQDQCLVYLNQTAQAKQLSAVAASPSFQLQQRSNALDDVLVDSALIAWDLRSRKCQNFVATLTCTWMDEIHCYSDRDQVSFPYVSVQMGLHVMPTNTIMNYHNMLPTTNSNKVDTVQEQQRLQSLVMPETHHRLFAHSQTPHQPLVHIAKSRCHWYYNYLKDCDFTQNDPMTALTNKKMYKIAVVVTGSFDRYAFQSSLQRLLQPLSRQGHYVDYYLSLTLHKAPAYRSNQNYMGRLTSDPIFDKHIYQEDNVTLVDEALLKRRISRCVREELEATGASLGYITFQDNYSGMDTSEQVINHRKLALEMYPDEDPDLRFPIFDIRDRTIMNRTAQANRNMLNLFYHMRHLYEQALSYEQENHMTYDYVLFLRDDTMWLHDFDFHALIEGNNSSSLNNSTKYPVRPHLFIPSCNARVPAMHPMEINDHIAIVSRDKASVFGKYFDELFRINMEHCAERLDDKMRFATLRNGIPIPIRGCNSEMILQYILETKSMVIQPVGQGMIPFQRMAFVKDPVSSEIQLCFHKYCQSHDDPLVIPPGLVKCTKLN